MVAIAAQIESQVLPNLIGGEWAASQSEESLPVYNPATGGEVARVPLSTRDEVRRATLFAQGAQVAWAKVPVIERAQVLFRMKQLLDEHHEELARLVTREHGKTQADAYGEVRRGIEVVELACAAPSHLLGSTLQDVSRGVDTTMYRFPVGVVAGITPFNFPAMIPLWMAPVAIVSGNAFVHKPSERTPLTSLRLAELWQEAGVPAGVISLVHGGQEVVEALIEDPGVRAVSFVGSQAVAQHVYDVAASHGKRVQALGGAKNFMLVMPDAAIAPTVRAILASAFGSAGERCLAGSVVIAVGGVAQRLVPELVAEAARMRVGAGDGENVDMGPVIRREHRDRIVHYIDLGAREGAALALDGRGGAQGEGFFLDPSIFTGVRPDMTIAQEEIFGPVLAVMEAQTLDEAVEIANRSRYGNAAVIFTESGQAAREFSMRIEAGMVGVNVGVPAPVAWFPFSGWKQSFYGDLHATGEDAYAFYTERKVVTTRWWGG